MTRVNAHTSPTSITIATYNLHLCQNRAQLIHNILLLAHQKQAAIICLQEVVRSSDQEYFPTAVLKRLGKHWKGIDHVGSETSWLSLGNCILWNTTMVKLSSFQRIHLPLNTKMRFHEAMFSKLIAGDTYMFQRRAIIGTFMYQGHLLQLANVHLDHIGGQHHRHHQLLALLRQMDASCPYRIVCGDFNTFDIFHTHAEQRNIQRIFGQTFHDVLYKYSYTADLFHVDFSHAHPFFTWFIQHFKIHVRKKLDYMWVHGFTRSTSARLDVGGSDHSPLFARIQFMNTGKK